MNAYSKTWTQENRGKSLIVASALILIAALLIPGSIWADHASAHPEQGAVEAAASTFSSSASSFLLSCANAGSVGPDSAATYGNACSNRSNLIESFRSGKLTYNAPGR